MSTAELTRDAPSRLLLTIRQVAEATGFCEKTIWANTAPRGQLACTRVGRSVRYSPVAVERWIATQTIAADQPVAEVVNQDVAVDPQVDDASAPSAE
jgi:predicted DNA-binding transcriptional regulator AlpA